MKEYYEVTGVDRSGSRFSISTRSRIQAMGINLWKGSVWAVKNGKRTLIKRVEN